MKKACMSNAKDPENRSKKDCVCGGHSTKAKNSKRHKPVKYAKDSVITDAKVEMFGDDAEFLDDDMGNK